jgi:hypothetical protein
MAYVQIYAQKCKWKSRTHKIKANGTRRQAKMRTGTEKNTNLI